MNEGERNTCLRTGMLRYNFIQSHQPMKNKFSELISQKPTKYIYASMSRSYPEHCIALANAVFFLFGMEEANEMRTILELDQAKFQRTNS